MLWTAPVLGPLRWLEPQPGGALLGAAAGARGGEVGSCVEGSCRLRVSGFHVLKDQAGGQWPCRSERRGLDPARACSWSLSSGPSCAGLLGSRRGVSRGGCSSDRRSALTGDSGTGGRTEHGADVRHGRGHETVPEGATEISPLGPGGLALGAALGEVDLPAASPTARRLSAEKACRPSISGVMALNHGKGPELRL